MIISEDKPIINKQKTRITLRCDFAVSDKCKNIWETSYRTCIKTRTKRNGKDCCNKCATKISNTGIGNPSFKYIKNENFFEKIDSEAAAYLLGWIASDGSIRDRTLHIELQNKDIKILRTFRDFISKKSKIVRRKNRNNSYITISSQKIISDICENLDVRPGNKQNKLRLPKLEQNLMRHFIRGFLEGDGWISIKKNGKYKSIMCGISTICPILQRDIFNFSKDFTCYTNEKGVEWYGSNALAFLDYLYADTNLVLNRKYNKYKKWKKQNNHAMSRNN